MYSAVLFSGVLYSDVVFSVYSGVVHYTAVMKKMPSVHKCRAVA